MEEHVKEHNGIKEKNNMFHMCIQYGYQKYIDTLEDFGRKFRNENGWSYTSRGRFLRRTTAHMFDGLRPFLDANMLEEFPL